MLRSDQQALIYALARHAGMPHCVLSAYTRYIENADTHFLFGEVIGQAHLPVASIPLRVAPSP